jgi:hypothetical protein
MSIPCSVCSSPLDEGSHFCARCGSSVSGDSGATVSAQSTTADPVPFVPSSYRPAKDLEGIGGWLILPAIGLVISPFMCLGPIFTDMQLLTGGDYSSLFANHPSLTTLLIFEIIINFAFLAAAICLNILFYTKKRIFPKCMIAFYAAQCVLVLADHIAATAIFPSTSLSSGLMTVIRSFIVAAVWIPYFMNSQRVEQTFLN